MSNYNWDTQFTELFDRCLKRYSSGDEDFNGYYSEDDLAFLKSIGYKPQEFFDFIEDCEDYGEPSLSAAVMIASVRRDYLDTIMNGELSDHEISPDELPDRELELEGFAWLPRILVKARAKLRGELHPDIMYCCGGDRNFLKTHDIAPADFLRAVWASDDDDARVVEYVQANAG